MALLSFILGLAIGIIILAWQKHQFNHQILRILLSVSKDVNQLKGLPLVSLVRREIIHLDRQNQLLRQELQTWEKLLDQAPIGYLQVDEDNQLLWCNRQARELLRLDRWQAGQIRLLLELVRSYELDRLIEKTRHSQTASIEEWVLYYSDRDLTELDRSESLQQSIVLQGHCFPLSQKQIGIFLINKQPLVELIQERDRAFCDLTHELRTPLTSIALVAETLERRLENPERGWLAKMSKEIDRLIDLVKNWLEISQLQQDPTRYLQYQSFDLRYLIFSVWETIANLAQIKQITLEYSGPDSIDLQADRARLHQVFLNLFDNAIKHSPPTAIIRVEIDRILEDEQNDREAKIIVNIVDRGAGFSELDLPHVFTRLYRGDKSRTRKPIDSPLFFHGGSGLGLSIVQQIIVAHGGQILAKNHPQTGGAWLQMILPQTAPKNFNSNLVTKDTNNQ